MRISVLILLAIRIAGRCVASAVLTAQELSSTDISSLWRQCNNVSVEIRTIIVDPSNTQYEPLFSNHENSLERCHSRLNSNIFLWIETNFIGIIANQIRTNYPIYIRRTTDKILNMKTQMHSSPLQRPKETVLLEINRKKLKYAVNIASETLLKKIKKTHIKYYTYKVHNKKGPVLVDNKRICLDFDGYSKLLATGDININDLRSSLCYLSKRIISLKSRKDLKTLGSQNRVSAQRETVINRVEVKMKVQTINGNKPVPVILSALAIVDRLAEETIRIKT